MLDYQNTLENRGLLAICQKAEWDNYKFGGNAGWQYPVYTITGKHHSDRQMRWRAANGSKPKFAWVNGQPKAAKYYYLPGLREAIQAAHGTLYIAFGDMDMLTFHAAGIPNVLSWFGEKSIPETLCDDLALLGVDYLKLYPDCDTTGMIAAWRIWRMTSETTIDCNVYQLPYPMDSKKDTNDLWIDAHFDGTRFKQLLIELPLIHTGELAMYDTKTTQKLLDLPANEGNSIWDEYLKEVTQLLGAPALVEASVPRWHCPLPSHADKHPSFTISYERAEFGWPACSCGIHESKDAWQQVGAALGLVYEDFKKQRAVERGYKPDITRRATMPQESETIDYALDELYTSRKTALATLASELRGENIPTHEPIEFPLQSLHGLGGFCELMWPGKLAFVLGVSGGGKTSLMETILEKFLRDSYDAVVFGPEWTSTEYAQRSVHRNRGTKGMTSTEIDRYRMALWEDSKGVEWDKRRGDKVADTLRDETLRLLHNLQQWPGDAYYLNKKRETTFDQLLDVTASLIERKRSEGRRVPFLFWDYIDRTPAYGKRDFEWLEMVAEKLKTFVMELDLIGWVFAQPRKADSQGVRDGELLDASSARNLSDNQCNLYLTLNLVYDANGKPTNTGKINVVKNSMGKTGVVEVYTDLDYLAWVDAKVIYQNLNG